MESRYSLVIAVAKRAKQLREGAPRLVEIKSKNHITIALEEISQGKVKLHVPTPEEMAAAEKMEQTLAKPEAKKTSELLSIEGLEEEEETPAEESLTEAAATSGDQKVAEEAPAQEA
ncbi:MAG: DNA-directed RNA polymerase subunit omega [Armatimonadota bacterium]